MWAAENVGGVDAANLEDREDALKRPDEALLELFSYLGELVKKHRGWPPYRPSPVLRGPRHLRVGYDARRTR